MRGSENVNFELLTRVYQLITNYFQAIKDVTYDGIYTASALTHFFFNDDRFLDDFWQYILHALQKVQEPQLFKANLSCIADFVLCYKDKMSSKFESFVPTLLGLLQEPAFNRDLKIDILNCLSEVFLNCGQHAKMYLQNFMNIIMLCCQGAI